MQATVAKRIALAAIGALSLAMATLGAPSPSVHANIISNGPPVRTGGTTTTNAGNGLGNQIRTQTGGGGSSSPVFGNGGNGGNGWVGVVRR